MKRAHFIEMRVFCREGEDRAKIDNKIHELFPFDFKKDKVNLREKTATGFDDKIIKIIYVSVNRERLTNKVLDSLMLNLGRSQRELLLGQLDSRLDERLHFYLRLDKDKLLNGEYEITEGGNCFHYTIAVAAYPHKREVAKAIVEEMLKN